MSLLTCPPPSAGHLPPDRLDVEEMLARLTRERTARLAEDERLVCLARAEILLRCRQKHGALARVPRQAAILRDLCQEIPLVIASDDILAGRLPEGVPTPEQEAFIAAHPELFSAAGDPGWLDSLSIYAPDWGWLLDQGLGGISGQARRRQQAAGATATEQEFLGAVADAMESVSGLVRRYAEECRRLAAVADCPRRRGELQAMASRCERVAWGAPATFADALQLIQLVHMVLSCLVGGRDVTPARLDQVLWRFYRDDTEGGVLGRREAVILLALFLLRLSQASGNATDSDDNTRRSPCRYAHLYVTVGGRDAAGRTRVNDLSWAITEAVRLLHYKEPTLLLRHHAGIPADFAAHVVRLAREGFPVTVYNDEVVIPALVRQGVPMGLACEYAHSACHNALIPGFEAGSGPVFHNLPHLLLDVLGSAGAVETFDAFWDVFRARLDHVLGAARTAAEATWRRDYADACPLLASALMPLCLERRQPAWQAASISHWNHHLLGLATAVDSLLAIERVVFREHRLSLDGLCRVLADNWAGNEALRLRLRLQAPRYGQGRQEANDMTARLGRTWIEAVERTAVGMDRLAMWPGFYSHTLHLRYGRQTPATPDGRLAGEPLSENLAPSAGTPECSPTDLLRSMASLPFDHTPSGAAVLSLAPWDLADEGGQDLLLPLLESYFRLGGLHLQANIIDPAVLQAAVASPENYAELMVRVTGFSAYFVRLSREVQEDLIARHCRGDGRHLGQGQRLYPESRRADARGDACLQRQPGRVAVDR